MNDDLKNQIIKHIFANFGVIESKYIDLQNSKSLLDNDFLLKEKIKFEISENKIWGCQFSITPQSIKVLLGDCSLSDEQKEYCLIIQLEGAPIYGLYLSIYNESLFACSLKDSNEWMICNTYLQATFLAGMEQVKDAGLSLNKCENYQDLYKSLLSFIKFYSSVFEGEDEG